MKTLESYIDIKNIDKSDWKVYKFEKIAKSIGERVEPTNTELEVYVGLEHLDSDSIHIKRYGKKDDVSGTKLRCYPGDVIFGRRRAYQRKAAIVEFDGFCSAHSLVLRANPDVIDPKLFPFFLHSDTFMHRAIDISVGSLSPTINWGTLKNEEFLLPPKDQQARLAELLWAADEMVETKKYCLDSLKIVESVFIESLIHGHNLSESEKVQSQIGWIPKKWEVRNFEELITINDGAHLTPNYVNAGVPFLRVTDIQESEINLDNVKYISYKEHRELTKRCKPEKGDILYSKNGTIGISKIIDWDWEFSTFVSLALFKIKDKARLDVRFLKVLLDSNHIKKEIYRRAKQGTITNLHLEEIRLFRIPLPPYNEQLSIVELSDCIKKSFSILSENVEASRLVKKSLINQIF